jgi:hypothetical protein
MTNANRPNPNAIFISPKPKPFALHDSLSASRTGFHFCLQVFLTFQKNAIAATARIKKRRKRKAD